MNTPTTYTNIVPNMDFRGQKVVNPDGTFTDAMQNFLDILQTVLISTIGNEGLAMPNQPSTLITTIQNNVQTSPTGNATYTCAYGTMIYDTTMNVPRICMNVAGVPTFKTIVTM